MKIYFVSGFLGSGKTTTIINTCKLLMKRGITTGVVTNDQGKFLVDNYFVKASGIPSVEVSNGCFCCNYDDFDSHILSLAENEKPDIVFAESVGSCADIIASVVKPFIDFREKYAAKTCLAAFADSRMLKARLDGVALPFSDDVTYIFDQQLAESDILVVNKKDLLPERDREGFLDKVQKNFPDKVVLLQSAFRDDDLENWLISMDGLSVFKADQPSLPMDFKRYADGERDLAWLDKTMVLRGRKELSEPLLSLFNSVLESLYEQECGIGHIKIFMETEEGDSYKFSLTGMDREIADNSWPESLGKKIHMVLNARVEMASESLKEFFSDKFSEFSERFDLEIVTEEEQAFHPGIPKPVHRRA